ncbi:MAG: hypothetical protein IIV11_04235, partial [Clostridia bacterium]|nr:hypothetical protein [Clostridia bacterium]
LDAPLRMTCSDGMRFYFLGFFGLSRAPTPTGFGENFIILLVGRGLAHAVYKIKLKTENVLRGTKNGRG